MRPEATADPRVGAEFLGYRIESLTGRGGMGVVYRAYDLRLKRVVAIKLIAPELSELADFQERFLAETELAASLEHPNVVPIHDAGEVDGQLYIAMRRRPRRTNRLAQPPCPAMARRVWPRPSSCHLPDSPTTISPAVADAPITPSGPGGTSSGSVVTPTARCTSKDALPSNLLASRFPSPGSPSAPASRREAPLARATHAPTSTAAQSWSAPPNGTSTGRSAAGPEHAPSLADEQRYVARCPVENRDHIELEGLGGLAVREEQIGVLLRCEPHEIVARLAGRERDGSGGGSSTRGPGSMPSSSTSAALAA
jgi:Protein kinase domain